MSLDTTIVDRIVADVLSAMHARTLDFSPQSPSKSRSVSIEVDAPKFALDLRHAGVITAEMLEPVKNGATVAVAKRHVLTPSGRDAVRKRSLTLRADAEKAAASKPGRSAILVVPSSPMTRRLIEQLAWPHDFPGCDGDAVADARSRVTRGDADFVAVIAKQPHGAAMRLNRTRGVRAVAILPQTPLDALVGEANWNVACLSGDGWSPFALKRAVERLAKHCGAGLQTCTTLGDAGPQVGSPAPQPGGVR